MTYVDLLRKIADSTTNLVQALRWDGSRSNVLAAVDVCYIVQHIASVLAMDVTAEREAAAMALAVTLPELVEAQPRSALWWSEISTQFALDFPDVWPNRYEVNPTLPFSTPAAEG